MDYTFVQAIFLIILFAFLALAIARRQGYF